MGAVDERETMKDLEEDPSTKLVSFDGGGSHNAGLVGVGSGIFGIKSGVKRIGSDRGSGTVTPVSGVATPATPGEITPGESLGRTPVRNRLKYWYYIQVS